MIGARVARLGERARRVLSVAAVIGRDFDFELLDAVSDLSADDLLDLLDAAAAAALVRELTDVPDRWSFADALTQYTLIGISALPVTPVPIARSLRRSSHSAANAPARE